MRLFNKAVGTHWRLFLFRLKIFINEPSSAAFNTAIRYLNIFIFQSSKNIWRQYRLIKSFNNFSDRLVGKRLFLERMEEIENNSDVNDIIIIGYKSNLTTNLESYEQQTT